MTSPVHLHRVLIGALAAVVAFWFVFALLSGAEQAGSGLQGLVRNSPNALPWVLALGLVAVAWRFPRTGGAIFALIGAITLPAFDTYTHAVPFAMITLPLVALGLGLVWNGRRLAHCPRPGPRIDPG